MPEVQLDNTRIRYTIRASQRARRLRITVRADGAVEVVMPPRASRSHAHAFVRRKGKWIRTQLRGLREATDTSLAYNDRDEYVRYKERARRLVHERLAYFNRVYGFSYNRVAIKNQKTRWGSCSHKRNLNFNYKILFLPPRLRDYIIVHELCHLKEFDHSPRFWRLVARTMPAYTQYERALRKKILSV